MKLYLAGPMTGIDDFNYPLFHSEAARLREQGHEVENPAENFGGDQTLSWELYLREALGQVIRCDAVAVLPGWRSSKGATLEVTVAEALGMSVLDAATLEPVAESIAEEAHRLTNGARQDDYGHPLEDFTRIGRLWEPILGVPATAEQVSLCMVQVKVSRELNRPKRDNRTDIAGYANCLDMVAEARARD